MEAANTNNSENLIDAIYSKFVLRDVLGKMMPGLILLSSIIATVVQVPELIAEAKSMPFWGWLGVFGLSWISAFALQSLGEKLGFIRYLPDKEHIEEKKYSLDICDRWYDDYIRFRMSAPKQAIREHEQLVVIMEACGNASIALCVSAIIIPIDGFLDTVRAQVPIAPWIIGELLRLFVPLCALLVLARFLWRMHREHRKRHFDMLHAGLKQIERKPEE